MKRTISMVVAISIILSLTMMPYQVFAEEQISTVSVDPGSNTESNLKWTSYDSGIRNLSELLWDGYQYFATTSDGKIYKSKDAIDWELVYSLYTHHFYDIEFNGKYYVAVGCEDISINNPDTQKNKQKEALIVVSNDGANWLEKTFDSEKPIERVATDGNRFIAIDSSDNLYASVDGHEWESKKVNMGAMHSYVSKISNIIWDGKEYLALGKGYEKKEYDQSYNVTFVSDTVQYNNFVAKSEDGNIWTVKKLPEGLYYYLAVGNGVIVAIGRMTSPQKSYIPIGAEIVSSKNEGASWKEFKIEGNANAFNNVIWNGSKFLVVGTAGIYVSTDGQEWVCVNDSVRDGIAGLIWDGKRFIMANNRGSVLIGSENDNAVIYKDNDIIQGNSNSAKQNNSINSNSQIQQKQAGNNGNTSSQTINLIIDGKLIEPDVKPVIRNGRVLVPVRGALEAMGIEVKWNGSNKTITCQKDGTLIILKVGSKDAVVNSKKVQLDAPPVIIKGSAFIPVRFIAESLGAEVQWDARTQTVIIYSK